MANERTDREGRIKKKERERRREGGRKHALPGRECDLRPVSRLVSDWCCVRRSRESTARALRAATRPGGHVTRSPAGGRTASSLSVSTPPCVYASARVFMRFARQCGARVWAALRPLALARDTEPTAREGEAPCARSPSRSALRSNVEPSPRFTRGSPIPANLHRRRTSSRSEARTDLALVTTNVALRTSGSRLSTRDDDLVSRRKLQREIGEKKTRFRPA